MLLLIFSLNCYIQRFDLILGLRQGNINNKMTKEGNTSGQDKSNTINYIKASKLLSIHLMPHSLQTDLKGRGGDGSLWFPMGEMVPFSIYSILQG